jgi:hypothetical protein
MNWEVASPLERGQQEFPKYQPHSLQGHNPETGFKFFCVLEDIKAAMTQT